MDLLKFKENTATIEERVELYKTGREYFKLMNVNLDVIVKDIYSDDEHFIWEILQNTEDANATWIKFTQHGNNLILEHNGRDFTERDIKGITSIGYSSKKETSKIGKFGVGFKSVFQFADTVKLYSGKYSIIMSGLLDFDIIPPEPVEGTRFVFECKNNTNYVEVIKRILKRRPEELIYLNNLKQFEAGDIKVSISDIKSEYYFKAWEGLHIAYKPG